MWEPPVPIDRVQTSARTTTTNVDRWHRIPIPLWVRMRA
jgi:hypothetical protein